MDLVKTLLKRASFLKLHVHPQFRHITGLNLEGQRLQSLQPSTEVRKQPEKSRKGRRVGHGKAAEQQPEEEPKHPKNSCSDCSSGVSALLPAVFRLLYRDPLDALFGSVPAVFNVGRLVPL